MRIGRSKRFDQARPFATLGIAALVWLAAPVAMKTFVRASFFEMTAPFPLAASRIRDLQQYWALRLHSDDELIQAGIDLSRLNASYSLSVQQNGELAAEVARLNNLLNLPPVSGYRPEVARVVQRNLSAWWQRVLVRKGADYGIPVGAPVVFSGGVVGRVSEVHRTTSVVDLITSPTVRMAALVEGDSRPVSYQGGINPVFGSARGIVEFVPLDLYAGPSRPRLLMTSGLGGVYPQGLTIGRIVRVGESTDGLFKNGDVELDSRLAELTEVTILVPLIPVAANPFAGGSSAGSAAPGNPAPGTPAAATPQPGP